MHIVVYSDAAAVADAAARLVQERIRRHDEPRRFTLALSGGSTPKLMYKRLRLLPDFGHLLNSRATILFSDERAVPPESEESNFRAAQAGLFSPVRIDEQIVHRMRGEAEVLAAEAARYEQTIVQITGNPLPSLDLVLLGMGTDGHIASLFPDLDFSGMENSLVVAVEVRSPIPRRLTFTLKLINMARTVLFLVTGEEKALALKKVLSAGTQADILPAGRVQAHQTIWMIDHAAAQLLDAERLRGSLKHVGGLH